MPKMGPKVDVSHDVNKIRRPNGDDSEVFDLNISKDDCPFCMESGHTIFKCALFAKICRDIDSQQDLQRALKIFRECQ